MTHHHEIPYRNMNEYEFRHQEEILRQILLEKFLQAMREDLSEWLSSLSLHVSVSAENFLNDLENGIILCQHARLIQRYAEEYAVLNATDDLRIPSKPVFYKERGAFPGSFVARDNVANFIAWCRELGIADAVIFESEDLVMRKNEKCVILTLMEVARRAYVFGVQPPQIVQLEKEIDQQIDKEKEEILLGKPPPKPRDLDEDNNLDTMVRNIVNKCECYDRFPIKKLAEGKYQVGRNAAIIFVRIMRKHVMVRVGGGWDTFDHYITKHDPCRTKVMGIIDTNGHSKSSLPLGKRLNGRVVKAEHTVATSTDTSSICSSSSDGSEPMCSCEGRGKCSHSNSIPRPEGNNENTDPTANFTQCIEEIDAKLKLLENRRPSLDPCLKDPMVYGNKSDRWLRSQLNTLKQTNNINVLAEEEKLKRGYTSDCIEQKHNKHKDTKTPKAERRHNSIASAKCERNTQVILEHATEACLKSSRHACEDSVTSLTSLDSSLSSVHSEEPTRRSCNDMSTQTDFAEEMKSSKIPRPFLCKTTDQASSKIPRPVMKRSKTSDGILLRKKNNANSNVNSVARKAAGGTSGRSSDRPGMRREKSDIPTSMRREKSNLTPRNSKSKQATKGTTTSVLSTPKRKDKSSSEVPKRRAEPPVKIRNGPELRV